MTATPAAAPAAHGRAAFHPLTVVSVERLTDDSVAVEFDVPDGLRETFAFEAGQSLTLRRTVGGLEHRRTYSICAAVGRRPRIGVREIPGGLFSSWLVHDVRAGDRIDVQAPGGSFRADPDAGARHLCIAAGSGITPMLSIASSVLIHPESEVTMLYGNRTTGTVMFAEELGDLKNRYGPRFDLIHVLSREPREVELVSGRLDADRLRRILSRLVPIHAVDHVWLCGPFGMTVDCRNVLEELGVGEDRVHVELFHVDEPPPEVHRSVVTAAGATSEVTITLDGRSTTAAMPKDLSILDGAALTRHDLPFACKGGVCGTCRAKVVGGTVDMRRNYALQKIEVEQGFVLTCQSLPVSDDVSVDFDS